MNTTKLPSRHLFGPGPTNPYPEATSALGYPLLGHLDPEFLARLDATVSGLRTLWGTSNERTLPLSATGSAGMETAFVNTIRPGDVAVVAVNGLFGERMCDVAARCGAEVVRVDHVWGQPVDAQKVLDAHPNPTVIAAVHAETSTGVLSDLEPLAREKGDALVIMDAVTSIGGMELRVDEWGIDVAYAGTQKCLGVAPGLAPFTISERAFARRNTEPQSWYFDLGMLGGYVGSASGGGRTYHHTAPVAMIASLQAGIDRVLSEGQENVWLRHRQAGEALQDGLQEMGLELFAAEGSRLPQLTSVKVPDGVDSVAVRNYLLSRFDIEIGSGVKEFASTVWRIGLMGPNASPASVTLLLGALKEAIARA
ncbi:pyridoxal-phosphate-dependent aminotransferase family protein [Lysinibacter cavernae]|uniref:Alanine-glyoxylate transaminase/serine-glyoxylate transaminase/serine-pyruvate transaminase n=1 Tax=Lysinibacter cavernae TaxID=1640652 RepID=A0A7X5R2L0_9MICO|nr:alanine--glyoxylate aminotransferase family protein [Lysinibacter cavernae]NIH54451.1 alanine-glyoxylate transaminase/serine-glyoxylate transaminase/serine-pyruvate transaminase [Lysinibacter cavernae]